jgi:hypothetical protein
MGDAQALRYLAPLVIGGAAALHSDTAMAHMAASLSNVVSTAMLGKDRWLRSVAANPNADARLIFERVYAQLKNSI